MDEQQTNPVMSNIDRVLMTTDWEQNFPLSSLTSLTRVGSDHCSLLLNKGEKQDLGRKCKQFFYNKQWVKQNDFKSLVEEKCLAGRERCPDEAYSLDIWHGQISPLRQFLKGWGDNTRGAYRRNFQEESSRLTIMTLGWQPLDNWRKGPDWRWSWKIL